MSREVGHEGHCGQVTNEAPRRDRFPTDSGLVHRHFALAAAKAHLFAVWAKKTLVTLSPSGWVRVATKSFLLLASPK